MTQWDVCSLERVGAVEVNKERYASRFSSLSWGLFLVEELLDLPEEEEDFDDLFLLLAESLGLFSIDSSALANTGSGNFGSIVEGPDVSIGSEPDEDPIKRIIQDHNWM